MTEKDPCVRQACGVVMGCYSPVADDDVYRTLQVYANGLLTKEQALEALKIKKLFNQYVFASNAALKVLKFIKAEEL